MQKKKGKDNNVEEKEDDEEEEMEKKLADLKAQEVAELKRLVFYSFKVQLVQYIFSLPVTMCK